MKYSLFVLFYGICLSFGVDKSEDFLKTQEFLSVENVVNKWGGKKFNAVKFKKGDVKVKAGMAADIIKSKILLGKTAKQVNEMLGDFTGFFWSDRMPAYIIDEGWNKNSDTWQIVFLLNDDGLISDVKVHKNCCATK